MIIGESISQRLQREERQAQTFPELGMADVPTVLDIDNLRRQEGRPPTSFGMEMDSVWSRLRPPSEENPAGELLNPAMGPVGPMGPVGQMPPSTGDSELDARLADMAAGFGDRNIPQVGAGESLANLGRVAGVGAELATSSYADALGLPDNWLTQELTRPANYIPIGKGVTAARAVTESIGGRLAVEAAQPLVEQLPESWQGAADLGINIAGQVATGGLYGRSGGALGMSVKDAGEGAAKAAPSAAPVADSASEALYGLKAAEPVSPNRFTQALDNLKRATRVGVPSDEIATPIMQTRAQVKTVADSLATRIGALADEASQQFPMDKAGRVTTVTGSPTIQDIAADLNRYAPELSPSQMDAMLRLRAEVEPIGAALKEQGVEFGSRMDVKPGGFYLPRGNAAMEGYDAPLKVRGGGSYGKAGYRKPAEFESMSQGIERGYEYAPFAEAMQGYARRGASDTVDAWAANQFKLSGVGEVATQASREQGKIARLPGLEGMAFPDEVANVANKVLNAEGAASGKFSNLIAVKTAIDAMARMAGSTLDASALGLQGLLGLSLDPRAYGTALKVSVKSLGNRAAAGAYLKDFDARAVAAGTPTSKDFIKAGQRFGGSITEFTGQGIPQRVERAIESPIPFTKKLVEGGLNPVRGSNRYFGVFGDVLRNELSDTAYQIARIKGGDGWSQLPEIVGSSNIMTGWTKRRLGGDLGEFVNYAPRWMEANLETLVSAARGTLPGANVGQEQARNAMLRLIGAGTLLTFAANEALGEETDTRLIVDGRDNPNFMRIRAGGYDLSLFGFYDRLVHLMVKAATGDTEGAARSLANAPSVGLAWDLLAGENSIGERTRDDLGQLAQTVGQRAVPMSGGEYLEGAKAAAEGDYGKAAAAVTVGATGLRGAPLSISERVRLGEYAQMQPEEQFRGVPAESWRMIVEKAPENLRPELRDAESFHQWFKAAEADYRVLAEQRFPGRTPAEYDRLATEGARRNPIYRAYLNARTHLTDQWVMQNPDLARQMDDEMRDLPDSERQFAPTKGQRSVIGAAP